MKIIVDPLMIIIVMLIKLRISYTDLLEAKFQAQAFYRKIYIYGLQVSGFSGL